MTITDLEYKIRQVLTPDLLHKKFRGGKKPSAGHCYAAAETAFHVLGGKDAGWTPYNIKHEGSPHWFLKHKSGEILDPTADQFDTPVPYELARGKGFLTKQPSKRAKIIMRRIGME